MTTTGATSSPTRPHCPLWAKIIATGFGSGLSPVAPGTMGSLAALLILLLFRFVLLGQIPESFRHNEHCESLLQLIPYWPVCLFLLYCLIGVPAAGKYAAATGLHDPKQVVIDEFAGLTLAMLIGFRMIPMIFTGFHCGFDPAQFMHHYLCSNWIDWLYIFLLFRLFDIWKPWPIKWLEQFPGGWGIMLDDLAAGLMAGVCYIALTKIPWIWFDAGAGWFNIGSRCQW